MKQKKLFVIIMFAFTSLYSTLIKAEDGRTDPPWFNRQAAVQTTDQLERLTYNLYYDVSGYLGPDARLTRAANYANRDIYRLYNMLRQGEDFSRIEEGYRYWERYTYPELERAWSETQIQDQNIVRIFEDIRYEERRLRREFSDDDQSQPGRYYCVANDQTAQDQHFTVINGSIIFGHVGFGYYQNNAYQNAMRACLNEHQRCRVRQCWQDQQ